MDKSVFWVPGEEVSASAAFYVVPDRMDAKCSNAQRWAVASLRARGRLVWFFTGSYVHQAGGGDVDYFSTTFTLLS